MPDNQNQAALLIMQGLSGSGKTTAARKLVQQLGGVMLRTDVERKRLHGLSPLAQSQSQKTPIYSMEATEKTYQSLLNKTSSLLSQNKPVIIDGAFLKKSEREMFRQLAETRRIPFVIVKCMAPLKICEHRIVERLNSGTDASEATPEILKQQKNWEEELTNDEFERAIVLKTDEKDWVSKLFFTLPSIL